MNRISVRFSLSMLLLLIFVGRGNNDPGGFNKSGSTAGPSSVTPETPAALQPAGNTFVYNFDADTVGQMPAKFHTALTGQGAKPEWVVKADATAPSQPNVLAQLSKDKTDYRFPLAILDEGSFKDLELSVKFKAVSGEVDRAAGMVFRLKDANNYYVVRANALEGNYRLYRVVNGQRVQFAGASCKVVSGEWHNMRAECMVNKITCCYDRREQS